MLHGPIRIALAPIALAALGGCQVLFGFEDRPLRDCEPGAYACTAEGRVRCDDDGLGTTSDACASTSPFCVGDGACAACVEDADCTSDDACLAGRCDAGACRFDDACPDPICADGGCPRCTTPSDCAAPGACKRAACEAGSCGAVDEPAGAPCGAGLVCSGTGACGACVPGRLGCDGAFVTTCTDDGTIDTASDACAVACSGGACVVPALLATGSPVEHMCAAWSDGSLVCWGSNEKGQLGVEPDDAPHLPTRVAGVTDVVEVAAGARHTCVRSSAGALACFGDNVHGQASGDGRPTLTSAPRAIAIGGGSIRRVAAGSERTCAVSTEGRAYCWGRNDHGQLGVGDRDDRAVPTPIADLEGVVDLALSEETTCALTDAGDVWCWGRAVFAGLGVTDVDATQSVPAKLDLSSIASIRAGDYGTVARARSGETYAWGGNGDGQLGVGDASTAVSPRRIVGLSTNVEAIDVGWRHGCAALAGSVVCWGHNGNGELGYGTCSLASLTRGSCDTPDRALAPAEAVLGLGHVDDLAAAWTFSCVIEDGRVRCWGSNAHGELGVAGLTPSDVPMDAAVPMP